MRIAVLASHPIQYQVPLFRLLARQTDIDLQVFFCSRAGSESYWDEGFGRSVRWDTPLMEGYPWRVLRNYSPRSNQSSFAGLVNPGVVEALRSGRYDVLITHGWGNITSLIAAAAAMALGVPILLRAETSLLTGTPRWKGWIKKRVLSRFFKRVAGFLSTGSYGTAFYQHYDVPAKRVFQMPYAVDNAFFFTEAARLESQRERLRAELGIDGQTTVVLSVGKLIPRKRPEDLLRAFNAANRSGNAALVFVGDGELRPKLERLASEESITGVTFAGFRNQTELPAYYAAADVFVLPSAFETWGLVVNEAMCFSLPIVASANVGATGDLVQHAINGFVYADGDVDALAGHLRLLLGNDALRRQLGARSRRIIQDWSYEQDIAVLRECLQSLLPCMHDWRRPRLTC